MNQLLTYWLYVLCLVLLCRYLTFLWNQYTDPTYDPQSNMWTYTRTEDMQTSIMWLYDNYPQDKQQFLLDLNEYIYTRSWDWKSYYENRFPTGDIGVSYHTTLPALLTLCCCTYIAASSPSPALPVRLCAVLVLVNSTRGTSTITV